MIEWHLEGMSGSSTKDLDLHYSARLHPAQHADEGALMLDKISIDADDSIAALEACPGCRPIRLKTCDQDSMRLVETQRLCKFRREILNR